MASSEPSYSSTTNFNRFRSRLAFTWIVAGRADQLGQFVGRKRVERVRLHDAGVAQIVDRPFDVSPGGVLHEHGADHDLERRIARPPVLWAERGEQSFVGLRCKFVRHALSQCGTDLVRHCIVFGGLVMSDVDDGNGLRKSQV